ncbi:MAG: carboxyl-terminal protease [Ignavibacteria bacterium]|nr:MAG: carboxyl-terminal protease [Ignavibacteria bacterium]KAF0159884.1 MAG: carboxyl-terminal protease [Ignavibacteria bacterium]
MMKRIFISLAAIFLFSGFLTKDNDIYFEINKSIDIFGRVYREVSLNYVDDLNPQNFMLAGIEGMLSSLDPYTSFIDISKQKDIEIITKGKYGGIGATIGVRNSEVTVVDLIEGFSAQRQGMRIGDIIIKINEQAISMENYALIGDYLKGEAGTSLSVTVKRENSNEPIVFYLVREQIEIKNVSYYGFVPESSNNAYLKLSSFSQSAGEEVKKALLDLKSKKEIKSLVMDLRGNPGGLLDAAIDVSEKFLKKGQHIVTVKGRDSLNVKNSYSLEEPILPDANIVLLIDESTASAAEIVAGALQDHDRAIVVGTNSFGKGLVQTIIPLPHNNSLKLTTARYYTPSGRSIQKVDYSDKGKIFEYKKSILKKEFKTDKLRLVYSAGGIMPDSVVRKTNGSQIVQRLLAEGMFFRFATNYTNQKSYLDYSKISEQKLLSDFSAYIQKVGFDFVSLSEKLIDQLKTAAKEEKREPKFLEHLDKMKIEFDANPIVSLMKHKDEIINLIREELIDRTGGKENRIKESLTFDRQFETAVSIISNQNVYNSLLNNN